MRGEEQVGAHTWEPLLLSCRIICAPRTFQGFDTLHETSLFYMKVFGAWTPRRKKVSERFEQESVAMAPGRRSQRVSAGLRFSIPAGREQWRVASPEGTEHPRAEFTGVSVRRMQANKATKTQEECNTHRRTHTLRHTPSGRAVSPLHEELRSLLSDRVPELAIQEFMRRCGFGLRVGDFSSRVSCPPFIFISCRFPAW